MSARPATHYPDSLRAALYRAIARLHDEVETQRWGREHGTFISGQIAGLREALALAHEHREQSAR